MPGDIDLNIAAHVCICTLVHIYTYINIFDLFSVLFKSTIKYVCIYFLCLLA